jgi:Ca-activated chloride channel homolog
MIGTTWQNPWVLWFLLALPLVGWSAWRLRRFAPRMRHPGLPGGFKPRPSLRRILSPLPLWLKLGAAALLVAGLARPISRTAWSEDSVNGVDIVLAMDVSTSMQIRDVKPSRLEAARQILTKFIAGRDRDRMGLVAFAGRPVTRCPLTTDRQVLRDLLDSTSNQGLDDGTAIGDALLMAGNRLRKSAAKSRVIVLLTDGQNNMGSVDPLSAAKAVSSMGIRIYTIGLGTVGVFTQDFKLPDGTVQQGQVQSDMDEKTLAGVASLGKGKFFRALDRDALQKAYDAIDALERTKIDTHTHWEVHERFAAWAFAALGLLLLAAALDRTWLRRLP